jgi:hypothetical protein
MAMVPLSFRVVGQDDYMLEIHVDRDGGYAVNSGTYTSETPRRGILTQGQEAELAKALASLGAPGDRAAPSGAEGFMAELTVGDGDDARVYRFWEGALDEDPHLRAVVRQLELI